MKQLQEFVRTKIKEHPQYKQDILDLYQLCLDEIEEGGSETHEIELCMSAINDLIL